MIRSISPKVSTTWFNSGLAMIVPPEGSAKTRSQSLPIRSRSPSIQNPQSRAPLHWSGPGAVASEPYST